MFAQFSHRKDLIGKIVTQRFRGGTRQVLRDAKYNDYPLDFYEGLYGEVAAVQPKPICDLVWQGEKIESDASSDWFHSYLGDPEPMPSNIHCGGAVEACLLVCNEHCDRPHYAYISRDNGKLHLAIPG